MEIKCYFFKNVLEGLFILVCQDYPFHIGFQYLTLKNVDLTTRSMELLIHSPILAHGWVASENVFLLLKISLITYINGLLN